ncbi:MAG: MBL fold metallo-hydrolase [Candidatus Heimdallarchaeota archaeon]|nr:MAG: MBL fold metallo-hydrolase [Candidatus Heimdallarchaeota archaeon]
MKITFLGQAGFMLQDNSSTLLIDPGKKKHGDVPGDIVFVTHNHFDHTRGVEPFLKRNPEAILICNKQVAGYNKKWEERIILVNPGDKIQRRTWNLKFIEGRHGLFSGVQNTGVIVHTSNQSFGHVGDSVDFLGFSQEEIDYLAIPISGLFAASPKKALNELETFKQPLPTIITMHWVWRNPRGFCKRLQSKFPDSRCIVPKDGESVPL